MILHIAVRDEWEAAVAAGGPYAPGGYPIDGFVHCSSTTQVAGTLGTWFAGRTDLVLLRLDEAVVGPDVVMEPGSLGEDELFPHLFALVPLDAVLEATPLDLDADGRHVLPAWIDDRPEPTT